MLLYNMAFCNTNDGAKAQAGFEKRFGRTVRLFVWGLTLLSVMAGFGCSTNHKIPAGGVLTLDGQPVEGATIDFSPAAGGEGGATATSDAEGNFELRFLRGGENRVLPGEYIVTVKKIVSVDSGKKQPDLYDPTKTMPVLESKNVLPERYNSFQKPILNARIETGKSNRFTFELKSK